MCVKSILFLILKYLPFQFNYIKKLVCWDKIKISLLSIHQSFRVVDCGWPPFLPRQHCTKMKCSLRIPSVNVTKSAGICRFGHIYTGIFNGKLHFLCDLKFWCLGKPKRNMYRLNIKRLTKGYMNESENSLSFFEYLGENV